jgi:hypothetical protein
MTTAWRWFPSTNQADLVAISVETYTAKRAYQIASEYRKRRVPVVMGGFHATLCPDEVARYAEAVVCGEAEQLWPQVIDDARHGRLEKFYRQTGRPSLLGLKPDRSIFKGKRYLPIGLIEAGRGCHFKCDFCAVQTVFNSTQTRRPVDDIIAEIELVKLDRKLFFFVDDNITSNIEQAKEFFRALIPLKIRWVSQSSINAAHDEEFLELLKRSGCQGVLIGFESLNPANLKDMNKAFNTMRGGFEKALANLRRIISASMARLFSGTTGTRRKALLKPLISPEPTRSTSRHLTISRHSRELRFTRGCSAKAGCFMTNGGWMSVIATTGFPSSRRA